MEKIARLVLFCAICTCTYAFAETYQSEHFIIDSPLDARLVKFVQLNCEAYYENMHLRFFAQGWDKPLKIYYSKTQSNTQELLRSTGDNDKVYYGVYKGQIPAVYTHFLMDSGTRSGWGTLFHEITHHFVALNYDNPPSWFNEGLVCFLSEQTRIVHEEVTVGRPNPWREQKLRNMIEDGYTIDVKLLTSLTGRKFYQDRNNYHPIRALFYWIYETGFLEEYIENVQQQNDYSLSLIEKITGKSSKQINYELLDFIQSYCYPAACLKDGQDSQEIEQKIQSFNKALEIRPEYLPVKLELAKCYYKNGEQEKCQNYLKALLDKPKSIEYREGVYLLGKVFYKAKDYDSALKCFQKALDRSSYYEYKHDYTFLIANCYHGLKEQAQAKQWYEKFLDEVWNENQDKWINHATLYLQHN